MATEKLVPPAIVGRNQEERKKCQFMASIRASLSTFMNMS